MKFDTVDVILNVLDEFRCTNNCEHDVNGDEAIIVEDILLVISAFGTAYFSREAEGYID